MEALRRYLTEEEQKRLLRHVDQFRDSAAQRDHAFMRLLLCTGMRLNEARLLTVGDALEALRTDTIFIPREHRKGQKTDHRVLVTQPVRESLLGLLNIRRGMGFADRADALLLCGRNGEGMTSRAIQLRVAMWAKAAGLPDGVSPHWFRHSRGMNIMKHTTSNDPRGIVQAALGHASIASTGIYTRVTREDLASALQEVDGAGRRSTAQLRKGWERRVGA